jgi:DNA-binding CsgD family transcriptional regulator
MNSEGRYETRDALQTDPAGSTVHATGATLDRAGEELGSPIPVLLRHPEPELRTPIAVATAAFRLTRTETQVFAQFLDGDTLTEAASILRDTRSTVKTHLGATYAKTGTHQKSDLVRRTVGLVTPLRG